VPFELINLTKNFAYFTHHNYIYLLLCIVFSTRT